MNAPTVTFDSLPDITAEYDHENFLGPLEYAASVINDDIDEVDSLSHVRAIVRTLSGEDAFTITGMSTGTYIDAYFLADSEYFCLDESGMLVTISVGKSTEISREIYSVREVLEATESWDEGDEVTWQVIAKGVAALLSESIRITLDGLGIA